jgi:hypothetical protein
MKRIVIVLVLLVVAVLGVDVLGDLTQSRPDSVQDGTATELVMSVEEDRFRPGQDAAAHALWSVCAAQTRSQPVGTGIEPVGDGQYRVVLEPAVGHHEELKLVGCLEDLTIDRVVGNVESFRTIDLVPDFQPR